MAVNGMSNRQALILRLSNTFRIRHILRYLWHTATQDMKIGLFGYGKMGKEIEKICLERNHEICWKISSRNRESLTPELLKTADVIIEFTSPHSAVDNILYCIEHSIPVVTGSTGWYNRLSEIKPHVQQNNTALFYASNFSVGVNIFWAVNKYMASLLDKYPEYRTSIEEIHHTQKLDAPSGTAITLAEKTAAAHSRYNGWANEGEASENQIPVTAVRTDNVPGTHTLTWQSSVDKLVFRHEAFNRSGFALGAVKSAEWLADKKGTFTMDDMLGL